MNLGLAQWKRNFCWSLKEDDGREEEERKNDSVWFEASGWIAGLKAELKRTEVLNMTCWVFEVRDCWVSGLVWFVLWSRIREGYLWLEVDVCVILFLKQSASLCGMRRCACPLRLKITITKSDVWCLLHLCWIGFVESRLVTDGLSMSCCRRGKSKTVNFRKRVDVCPDFLPPKKISDGIAFSIDQRHGSF